MTALKSFYIVPGNPLSWDPERAALNGVTPAVVGSVAQQAVAQAVTSLATVFGSSHWGAHGIPGDPQGRWVLDVCHAEPLSEQNVPALPGVIALPHVYSAEPVGAAVAAILGPWAGVLATDTMLQVLGKLRAAGMVGARPEYV